MIQPTGSGKSLCYTIPPLYDNVPTISLMKDQVYKLVQSGISATYLGSAQQENVMKNLHTYRFIYTTPESFYDRKEKKPRDIFLQMATKDMLSIIAVDEAHLIFSWRSFRYVIFN